MVFTSQIKVLATDDEYSALPKQLVVDPGAGAVIKGTGGLRKIRMAIRGGGKSGGERVIYYVITGKSQIAMLFAYPKSEQDDLSAEQAKALKKVVGYWKEVK